MPNLQSLLDFLVPHLPAITGLGGIFGGLILRHVSPRIAAFMRRNLDIFLGWIQHVDDPIAPTIGWGHALWDGSWGWVVGTLQQIAGDEAIVRQAFRIMGGQKDLRKQRFLDLLQAHIDKPGFEKIVKDTLPEELKEVWNEAMSELGTRTIAAKGDLSAEKAKAIVAKLAPAAEVLAAQKPVSTSPLRKPEIQAMIEALRAKSSQ